MFSITKEFTFEAAHHLPHLPEGHKCARPHGHGYRVLVELEAYQLNEQGFVVDYGDLAPLREYLDTEVDHRDLNQLFDFPTTAENLARHLYAWCKARWPQTVAVSVSETAQTWATYTGG